MATIEEMKEIVSVAGKAGFEAVLDRKDDIIRMDFKDLEKLGTVLQNVRAASNGCGGCGCRAE